MLEKEKISIHDNKFFQSFKSKITETNDYVGKKINNKTLKYLVFVSAGVLLMKTVYQMQGSLIVYDSSVAFTVIAYGVIAGLLLSFVWDGIFDALNGLVIKYLGR